MQSATPPRSTVFAAVIVPRARAAASALALVLAAACVDQPTSPELRPPPDESGAAAALDCRVDVRAETLQCAPVAGAGGGSAVILGGQGTNVRLRSTGMTSDGAGTFRMDVTVENLIGQILGTTDGVTPSAQGVRVFFTEGPTSATGAVEVANPTGTAMFTAASQPYFQYDGLLAPGDTSEAREWRFSVAPTVVSFQFRVLVSAAVAQEQGWLRMAPFFPNLSVGESMPFHAYLHDGAGRPLTAGPITWTSGDSTVVRVAADGTVTALKAGFAVVFVTDGVRTSHTLVSVRAPAGDVLAPTAHELTVTPGHVTADGADSLVVSARLTDAGTGARYFFVRLTGPSETHEISCFAFTLTAGTRADGTFTCSAPVPPGVEPGVWRVTYFWVQDAASNGAGIQARGDVLKAMGVPASVYVRSPAPDLQAPTLTALSFTPDSVEADGVDSVTVTLQVQDAGTGADYMFAAFRDPSGNSLEFCETFDLSSGTPAAATFQCRLAIPPGAEPGDWMLDGIQARDATGNFLLMDTAELDSAGYPTVLRVSGPPADTVPPELTGFSFSPGTVAANGVDSVTVVTDVTDAGVGLEMTHVNFTSPSGQEATCQRFLPAPATTGPVQVTCRFAIGTGRETGTWRVSYVIVEDASENARMYYEADLQALGFPVTLTVTP